MDNKEIGIKKDDKEIEIKKDDIEYKNAFVKWYNSLGANKYDTVDNPKHYCSGAHECIDVMEQIYGTKAVIDFCRCNIFKYRFRSNQKNGEEDIKKAEWYEDKLIELNEKLSKNNPADYEPKPIYYY